MTQYLVLALTGRTDLTEVDLNPRCRRVLAAVRADAARTADLTARWRGARISGQFTYEGTEHVIPWEGVVERVLVGNPYNRPHVRLTDGRVVPLPEGTPDA